MRIFTFSLFLCCCIQLQAQSDASSVPDRSGQFWVDGALGSTFRDDFQANYTRLGYFFSDRFMVGLGLGSSASYSSNGGLYADFQFNPFARYYLTSKGGWRPYAEAELQTFFGNNSRINQSLGARFALGLEKEILPGVLANVEADYTRNDFTDGRFNLGLGFNSLLGGYNTRNSVGSQLKKGSWNFGHQLINFSFGEIRGIGLNTFDVNLSPEFAYFLTNKLMVDVKGEFFFSKFDYPDNDNFPSQLQTSFGANIDLGLRRYFTTHKKINFFVEARLKYEHLRRSILNNGATDPIIDRANNFSASAAVGGTLFLNPNTSLDFGLKSDFTLQGQTRSAVPSLFVGLRFWGKKQR